MYKISITIKFIALFLNVHCFNQLPKLEFGDLNSLITDEKSENYTVIVENRQDFLVQLKCVGDHPTEWVLDYDGTSSISRNSRRRREEKTERKRSSELEGGYEYIAKIELQYRNVLKEVDELFCKHVAESEQALRVTLTPSESGNEVLINQEVIDWSTTEFAEKNQTVNEVCPIMFYVNRYSNGKFYLKCTMLSTKSNHTQIIENGKLDTHGCSTSAAHCANTYRRIRVDKHCISIMDNPRIDPNSERDGWIRGDTFIKQPTILICKSFRARRIGKRGSMELFFAEIGRNVSKKLRIAQIDELIPNDLITLNLEGKELYYDEETVLGQCIVPRYGFSFNPIFKIVINGSVLREESIKTSNKFEEGVWLKEINETFDEGNYTISCIGPVWNSVQWGIVNKSITVKKTIPPYFDQNSVNITFKLDDVNTVIECIAFGDPKPEIFWEFTPTPLTKKVGSKVEFIRVTDFTIGDFICKAKNKFGKVATKIYRVRLDKPIKYGKLTESRSSGLSTGTLVGVVVSVVIVLILAILVVLFIYCKFLKLGIQIANSLTYEEVKEFTEGKAKDGNQDTGGENGGIEHLPYNDSYEIKRRDHLVYDENSVLGSGAYGIVMNGKLKLKGEFVLVAVKTVKKNVEISYFKALLSELKIMAHIGNHENIVNLMGAWTCNIKNRELFVCVELCKLSLFNYLQSSKDHFHNLVKGGELISCTSFSDGDEMYQNISTVFSTFNLIQWSIEISTGMEFLVSKNVIHGDLATRNVLLSNNLVCKICDFGLARQLIDYNYIKSQSCPLPWKWMAIESLSEMKFSLKSDVWSFGVTLWEIFSLGMTPYPGSNWSMDFVEQLRAGLRMKCPHYAPAQIYKMMLETWHELPRDRPTFTELREDLQNILEYYI